MVFWVNGLNGYIIADFEENKNRLFRSLNWCISNSPAKCVLNDYKRCNGND